MQRKPHWQQQGHQQCRRRAPAVLLLIRFKGFAPAAGPFCFVEAGNCSGLQSCVVLRTFVFHARDILYVLEAIAACLVWERSARFKGSPCDIIIHGDLSSPCSALLLCIKTYENLRFWDIEEPKSLTVLLLCLKTFENHRFRDIEELKSKAVLFLCLKSYENLRFWRIEEPKSKTVLILCFKTL